MRFPVCRKRRKAKAICRKRFRCLMSGPSKVDRFYCNEWKGKHQSLIFNELLMRIIVFLIAAVAQIAAAVFGLFILLLGLNGFSEREATPALIFFKKLTSVVPAPEIRTPNRIGRTSLGERTKDAAASGFISLSVPSAKISSDSESSASLRKSPRRAAAS